MKPQRADILPGGIIVLDTVLEIIGRDKPSRQRPICCSASLLQERDASAGQRSSRLH